ncbi:MAG: transcription antitermination factor NusB [Gemmatimonadota bacterium]
MSSDADPSAREAGVELLEEVGRGRRLDVAWEARAPSLGLNERRWVQEAVFGSIRLQGRLDFLLDLHLDRGIQSVPEPLLRLLRFGAYQLLYMDSVPGYAAVSETVTLARGVGGRKGAGLVNAVLRSLGRAGAGPVRFPSFEADPAGYLSTWGSHPRWLVERWIARFGSDTARSIVEAGNRVPGLFLRPVGRDPEAAAETLRRTGIQAEPGPEGSDTLRLASGTDPVAALAAVPAIVQDPAAAGVVRWVRAREGEWLADLCAAPGGKGIALAGAGARLIASDASFSRLARVREGLRRLGLPERLVVARGENPPFGAVDVVLADVPCSGTGTLARHPDARWRLAPDTPGSLARTQSRILAGAASLVKPGGKVVYATCTLEKEENEGVVEAFLSDNPGFIGDDEGRFFRVLPGDWGTDGAFAASLRRIG